MGPAGVGELGMDAGALRPTPLTLASRSQSRENLWGPGDAATAKTD
jgi:hypothetical protein